jgi:hypothetical protein
MGRPHPHDQQQSPLAATKQFFIAGRSVARYPALTSSSGFSSAFASRCWRRPRRVRAELYGRWRQRNPRPSPTPRLRRDGTAHPRGAIFISYCGKTSTRLGRRHRLEDWRRRLARRAAAPARRPVGGGDPGQIRRRSGPPPLISKEPSAVTTATSSWNGSRRSSDQRTPGGRKFIVPTPSTRHDGNPSRYRQVPKLTVPHWGRAPRGEPTRSRIGAPGRPSGTCAAEGS